MGASDTQAASPIAEDHPFFAALDTLVTILADGLDHPEVWAALAEAAKYDDVVELCTLIGGLLPIQSSAIKKSMSIIGAMLCSLVGDHDDGLEQLDRIAIHYAHCAQVAGAQFYIGRLRDPHRTANLSHRFCDQPFANFETLVDGSVSPCCSIWTQTRFGNLDVHDLDQIWNGPAAQAMRASILDGSFSHCNKQRCTLIMEDTLPLRVDITDPRLRRIIDEGMTKLDSAPQRMMLAHDVTCNLACPSCRDGMQVASDAATARFDVIEHQIFRPLLDSGDAKQIALSGQGDPWSSPHYRSILRYMADTPLDITLNLHTNALLMGPRRWEDYAGLDRYRALVDVSIDACTPWVYAEVRRPGRWSVLFPNLQFIAEKRASDEFRAFHLNATIQLDNYHEMPALVEFAQRLNADSVRMYMIQQTGGHLRASYAKLNIASRDHPLHTAFLETLRDPRLGSPTAHLYDVATWRARAFDATLPSDRLGADYSRDELSRAIIETNDAAVRVALCAAGRTRFREDLVLPLQEAEALSALGFAEQANYRLNERVALGGEAITLY